jgi:hypothetical protein
MSIVVIIIFIIISFMQGIYTYIPETNYVPREYIVAAILSLLFMVPIFYVYSAVWVTLSPYFIQFLLIFCKVLSAVHITSNHFSNFLFCPSLSLFCLCTFRCILGLVALTVSEWSALLLLLLLLLFITVVQGICS